jgi:hypothetical protein
MNLPLIKVFDKFKNALKGLSLNCLSYDKGEAYLGPHIAHQLRLLLHNTSVSHAMLHQLGKENENFASTASDDSIFSFIVGDVTTNPGQETELPVFYLAKPTLNYGNQMQTYFPKLNDIKTLHYMPFVLWWQREIICSRKTHSNQGREFSFTRKEIVLAFANKLGGSHLDPAPAELLVSIDDLDNEIMGWDMSHQDFVTGEVNEVPHSESPFLGSVRQIAHELFLSLKKIYPNEIDLDNIYFSKIASYDKIGHNRSNWESGAIASSPEYALIDAGDSIKGLLPQNDKAAALGLTSIAPSKVYAVEEYDYCIIADSTGNILALERGKQFAEQIYNSGDTIGFCLTESEGIKKVSYLHNNNIFYESKHFVVAPLSTCVAFKHVGAKLEELQVLKMHS